jgi:hypothetical protein
LCTEDIGAVYILAALGVDSTVWGDTVFFFCSVYNKLWWGYGSHLFLSLLRNLGIYILEACDFILLYVAGQLNAGVMKSYRNSILNHVMEGWMDNDDCTLEMWQVTHRHQLVLRLMICS